ncbi:MAG: hypothetical protein H6525_02400 [Actinobacteria bacterium]|nr:hypothetical protein [Actinomycetota bacterium]MCB9411689.1 hypothetical protein [Actinomycetota bacterium]
MTEPNGTDPDPGGRRARSASVLLLAVAFLTVSPFVALSQGWAGAEWVAMWATTTRTPLTLAAGLLQLAAPTLFVMLVLAAVGTWRRCQWSLPVGSIALLGSVLVVAGPLFGIGLASWLPLGRALALATIGVAAVMLWAARRGTRSGRTRLFVWGVAGYTLAAAAAVVLALVAGGLPGAPLISQVRSGPGVPERFAAPEQEQNPAMAAFPFAAIHNDAAQSDLYPGPVAIDPGTAELRTFTAGGGCASIAWDSTGNLVAVCVADAVTAHVIDPESMAGLASYRISDRPYSADFLTDFGGGGYMYLDHTDAIVTPTLRRTLLVLEQVRSGDSGAVAQRLELRPRVEFDLDSALVPGERATSALPDSSGRIWFVGQQGTVGFVQPDTGEVVSRQWPGEDIENSFAVGEDDDVYVVSSTALRRLTARGGDIEVQWEAAYDAGTELKPGQTSAASGTTPTLHGEGLVSIADNGEPTHVDVFATADGTRLCHLPVFAPGEGATENSLVALGDDLLIENNLGYGLLDVVGGHSTAAGLVRIDVDRDRGCAIGWRNDTIRIPSVVSKASAADGIALTYSKDESWWGADRWWITAVGLADGRIVWQRLAGVGSARNNHYAAIYLDPRGNVVVGTAMGIVALAAPRS